MFEVKLAGKQKDLGCLQREYSAELYKSLFGPVNSRIVEFEVIGDGVGMAT